MVEITVAPVNEVSASLTPQAPPEPTPQPPAPVTREPQVEAEPEGLSWIDNLGETPEPSPGAYQPLQYVPVPVPQGYPQPAPYQSAPAPAPTPADLINAFVKDPKGFVADVAKQMAAEQVAPFVEAVREYVQLSQRERVVQSVAGSRERLREYARGDSSLTNPVIAQHVNNYYSYFINNAMRGSPEAIAALNNPMTPFLVSQASKARAGALGSSAGPVHYAGGRLEGRSTVGPQPATNLDPVTQELGTRWGLSIEKMQQNEAEALKYLNQK